MRRRDRAVGKYRLQQSKRLRRVQPFLYQGLTQSDQVGAAGRLEFTDCANRTDHQGNAPDQGQAGRFATQPPRGRDDGTRRSRLQTTKPSWNCDLIASSFCNWGNSLEIAQLHFGNQHGGRWAADDSFFGARALSNAHKPT
ncbi:MAG: hypothetical protein D6753_03425 [Planctomycetota bacterium]|nr:MAG: hypothetical protein D6753_03425 [Planctomycetota bacterium]